MAICDARKRYTEADLIAVHCNSVKLAYVCLLKIEILLHSMNVPYLLLVACEALRAEHGSAES